MNLIIVVIIMILMITLIICMLILTNVIMMNISMMFMSMLHKGWHPTLGGRGSSHLPLHRSSGCSSL